MAANDHEKNEIEGICLSCASPQIVNPKPKKGPDGTLIPEPEPLKVKLSMCFHCSKMICEACRIKHYMAERQAAINVVEENHNMTGNIADVCRI